MAKNDFQLAIFGCGRWGKNHVRTAAETFGPALRYVCDSDPRRFEDVAGYISRERFTTDMAVPLNDKKTTAVIIATPAETHFEVAKQALKHGKHVLVEKPLALFSQQARELERFALSRKRVLMVGHLLLFHPAVQKIKEIIDDGRLGKLEYIYSNRLNLGTVRKEENILWSFAPHDISVLNYLTGREPIDVYARGGVFLQPGIHDVTMTLLRYPDNVQAHIHVSWLHPFKEHRLVVIGDKSMIVFEDTRPGDKLILYPKGIDWVNGEPIKRDDEFQVVNFDSAAPLQLEQKHFFECVTAGKRPLTDSQNGIKVLEILEAAQSCLEQEPPAPDRTARAVPQSYRDYFVHETALVDEGCQIGNGTRIWHFSHVQSGACIGKNCTLGQNVNIGNNVRIGNNVKIQNNVSVYEGVEIEDYVFCGPSMVFTNVLNPRCEFPQRGSEFYLPTKVGFGASIGANATIVCGHSIGKFAFIAAGAVVTKDVPDYALILGNPGRISGWVCRCGNRLQFEQNRAVCAKCHRRYQLQNQQVKELPETA